MSEMLLINPRKRRKSRKAASPAQKRARAKFAAAARARSTRRSNPIRARRRRRNPAPALMANVRRRVSRVRRHVSRRRRNPITLGGTTRTIMSQVRQALIGGAGAVAMDALWARVNGMLPLALQNVPGVVDAGTAVKAVATVVLGKLLAKPTKGLSTQMALGSLTVQAHGIISGFVPAGMLGFYSPAQIVQGTQRVGPIRRGVSAYSRPGVTPLLNGTGAYLRPGNSPLLSGGSSYSSNAREREGVSNLR